jgi:hypothetical protein
MTKTKFIYEGEEWKIGEWASTVRSNLNPLTVKKSRFDDEDFVRLLEKLGVGATFVS